jgi:membrane protein
MAAIPIFLVWTYVSWVVVLAGAQVAASHQNERLVRQRFRARQTDQALRETLAVVIAAHVARDFLSGSPPRDAASLASLADVPALTVEETLDALVRAGLLARTTNGEAAGFLPARDLDGIRAQDLRDALRRDALAEGVRAELDRHLGPELHRVLEATEAERRSSPQNVTLRELAGMLGPAPASAPAPSPQARPQAAQGRRVLDAK